VISFSIDKTISADLMTVVRPSSMLHHKSRTFIQDFKENPSGTTMQAQEETLACISTDAVD
jgi:hypothetical protein